MAVSEDQSALLALIVAVVVVLSRVSEWTRVGRTLSATIVAMVFGIILSNVGFIPRDAPLYGHIFAFIVPVALPMFLFDARWSRIVRESGRLLYLVIVGAIGVVIGAVLATQVVNLGPFEAGWAGTFSASYIGGTINFIAVSTSLELPREEIAIALSTDTVVGTVLLMLLVIVPSIKAVAAALPGDGLQQSAQKSASEGSVNPLSEEERFEMSRTVSGALGVGASLVIVLLANWVTDILLINQYSILIVTLLTLIFANAAPSVAGRLSHSYSIGTILMLTFFFIIGASADIPTMIHSGKAFLAFLVILIVCHLLFLAVASRYFRFSVSEAVIASCACAIGPTVAAGVAANKNWYALVAPGIVCGVLGYAIANFIGVGLARLLS